MVGDPYADPVPQDATVISQGQYAYLKIQLTDGDDNPLNPHTGAFRRIDVREIRDPSGADITEAWSTNQQDPDDPDDDFDATHNDYVGDKSERSVTDAEITDGSTTLVSDEADFDTASPSEDVGKELSGSGIPAGTTIASVTDERTVEMSDAATQTATGVDVVIGTPNIGLFHNGTGSVAQKIKVPDDATVTINDDTSSYEVDWKIRYGTDASGDPLFATLTETFNIRGVSLEAKDSRVTVPEVRRGFETPEPDSRVEDLIVEAAGNINSLIKMTDASVPNPPPGSLLNATIYEARRLLLVLEESTGRSVNSVSQGGMSLGLRDPDQREESLVESRDQQLKAFLGSQGIYGFKHPQAITFNRGPRGGRELGAAHFRSIPWLFKDY